MSFAKHANSRTWTLLRWNIVLFLHWLEEFRQIILILRATISSSEIVTVTNVYFSVSLRVIWIPNKTKYIQVVFMYLYI